MKGMKGGVVAGLALLLGLPLMIMLMFVGSEEPAAPSCSPGGSSVQVASIPSHAIGSWSADQVRNAALIVQAGAAQQVPAHGQVIAVMVAMGESTLRVLGYGDQAGPDSRGLFQQRDSWGPLQVRMDPAGSAKLFYDRLVKVSGWESMEPTLAAHAVQRNADPWHYSRWWGQAQQLVNELVSGTGQDVVKQVVAKGGSAPAGSVAANVPATETSGCGTDGGGAGFAVNTAVAYVGAYTQAAMTTRAQAFIAANGQSNVDPFFSTEGDGSWYRDCQHFVANFSGRATSGYSTAADAWAGFVASGMAHPADAVDGHAPPPGSWLYYSGGSAAGHVAVYLGNGQVVGTDTWGTGKVGIGPASDITNGKWHLTYLGWAAPWGAKVAVKTPSTVQNAGAITGHQGAAPATTSRGSVVLAQANIPQRSQMSGYTASMKRVLTENPDFVTLNEQAGRSLAQLVAPAPGYAVYRDPQVGHDPGAGQTLDTAILFRADTWQLVAGGRIKLVDDDRVTYQGHLKTWDRFATWVTLRRISDGTTVSVVSVHQMTNPAQFGPDKPLRQAKYGQGMDALTGLVQSLQASGTVLVGGDFNVTPSQQSQRWSAPAKMSAAGFRWYSKSVDYLFAPAGTAAIQQAWTGQMVSDHPWIAARIGLG